MILRNPIMSDQPRMIGSPARVERVPTHVAQADSASLHVVSHLDAQVPSTAVAIEELAAEAAPNSTAETILSFEAVAAWLVVQDAETRMACASLLSDELIQVHEKASAEGFAAGEQKALAASAHERNTARELYETLAREAAGTFEHECEMLQDACVEIVAEAFAKIAGTLLPTREATLGAVAEVLKRVRDDRKVTIRVSREDLEANRIDESALSTMFPGRQLSVVADGRIEVGGCIVESRLGNLDGRFEVQLRELFATLKAAKSAGSETA